GCRARPQRSRRAAQPSRLRHDWQDWAPAYGARPGMDYALAQEREEEETQQEPQQHMKTIKAGRQLLDFIRLCYAAKRPPLLIGRHGVGKSQILEQAASQMGIDFVCRDLSLMEPPDLVGMPRLDGNVTRYLPPAFLPTKGKGLLVFEELNRCAAYMRAPCLQLL